MLNSILRKIDETPDHILIKGEMLINTFEENENKQNNIELESFDLCNGNEIIFYFCYIDFILTTLYLS